MTSASTWPSPHPGRETEAREGTRWRQRCLLPLQVLDQTSSQWGSSGQGTVHTQQAGQRICMGPYGTRGRGCRCTRGQMLPPTWALGTFYPHWGHMTLMTKVLEVDGAAATAQHSLSHMETTRTGGARCSQGHLAQRGVVWPEPQPSLPGSWTCLLCRLHLSALKPKDLTPQNHRWPLKGP